MRKILIRATIVWFLIMIAESLHGIARVLFLAPRLGDFRARQIAVFSGGLIILAIVMLLIQWVAPLTRKQALIIGCLWVFLTVLFELGLGRLIMHLSWERIASDYNLAGGGLMSLGLLVLLLSPLIAAKIRKFRLGKSDAPKKQNLTG